MDIRRGIALTALIACSRAGAESTSEISFATTAGHQVTRATTADCARMPAFGLSLRDPELAAVVSDAVGDTRLQPKVFLQSTAERTFTLVAGDTALWQRPVQTPAAACLTQCFRLPQYARTTRLKLSASDGTARCATLPSADHPSLDSALIDCGDGSYWRDVVAQSVHGSWLVCATVLNTRPSRTRHMMTVSYIYHVVQIADAQAESE
jgi:hypothetical protein